MLVHISINFLRKLLVLRLILQILLLLWLIIQKKIHGIEHGGERNTSEVARAIALDSSDNIYIIGSKSNPNFPGSNKTLMKFNSLGTLEWNKTLGENDIDSARAIALDSLDNIYMVGMTVKELIPDEDEPDDNPDDNGPDREGVGISFGNYYLIFSVIGIISLAIVQKRHQNKN